MGISVSAAVARFAASCRWIGGAADNFAVSPSFTPANGSLLVVCINNDGDTASAPTFAVTGGGLTWTKRVQKDGSTTNNRGVAAIFTAPVVTGASMQVSVGHGAEWPGMSDYRRCSCKVYIVTGQHASPIGASTTGTTTTDPTDAALTATGAGRMFGCATDWNQTGAPTSTDEEDSADYSGEISVVSAYKAADHVSGSQTINFNYGGAPASNWAMLEILAVAGGGGGGTNVSLGGMFFRDALERVRKIGSGWKRHDDGRLLVPAYPMLKVH